MPIRLQPIPAQSNVLCLSAVDADAVVLACDLTSEEINWKEYTLSLMMMLLLLSMSD